MVITRLHAIPPLPRSGLLPVAEAVHAKLQVTKKLLFALMFEQEKMTGTDHVDMSRLGA